MIAGAGLDVFEQEPMQKESPLWGFEIVIIIPNSSGSTEHYNKRAMAILIANFKDYLKTGMPGINLVNLEAEN